MRETPNIDIQGSDRIQVHCDLDGREIMIATEKGNMWLTRSRARALVQCLSEVLEVYSIAEPEPGPIVEVEPKGPIVFFSGDGDMPLIDLIKEKTIA